MDIVTLSNSLPYYKQEGWTPSNSENKTPYFLITLIFTIFVFALEKYLDIRQRNKYLRYKNKALPQELIQINIPEDKFRKSLEYGLDKSSFGLFESSFRFSESTVMLILGLFPYCWDQATWFSNEYRLINSSNSELYSEIVITIVFFGITMIYEEILSLPFTLYFTFVIEQKHGFNKQTLFLFFTDKIKVIGLTAVIGIPVLSVIIWIIKLGGEYFYFYIWAFLFVFRYKNNN